MKPEQQRIAIAEACGFKCSEYSHELKQLVAEFTPDYLNDLNAMAEAEQSLWLKDWNLRYVFCDHLADMIRGRRVNRNEWGPELMLDATAAQRAEAFLKTVGKWEDDKC
jgi:hypothetical protein